MQKPIASLIAVGLLLLAACGPGGAVEPGPITSFEDIAGTTYERQGIGPPGFIHFFEDGTFHGSSNRDLVEDPGAPQRFIVETRFEGTKVFLKDVKGDCLPDDNAEATYEIHLLENGNLQFVLIEDTCAARSSGFSLMELAPVP